MVFMMTFYSIEQLSSPNNQLHIIMNLYYLITSIICTILYFFAYCKNKEYFIPPAYVLCGISIAIKMMDIDYEQEDTDAVYFNI